MAFVVNDTLFKGTLTLASGDNLASHYLGGFNLVKMVVVTSVEINCHFSGHHTIHIYTMLQISALQVIL